MENMEFEETVIEGRNPVLEAFRIDNSLPGCSFLENILK